MEPVRTVEMVTQVIIETLPHFLQRVEDPYDINCGLCEDFANSVVDQLGGETDKMCVVWIEDIIDTPYPDAAHAVVRLESDERYIYFDAECPGGVRDLCEVPAMANQKRTRAEVITERQNRHDRNLEFSI